MDKIHTCQVSQISKSKRGAEKITVKEVLEEFQDDHIQNTAVKQIHQAKATANIQVVE